MSNRFLHAIELRSAAACLRDARREAVGSTMRARWMHAALDHIRTARRLRIMWGL